MTTKEQPHRWGNPDKDGVRACNLEGCTVRTARAFSLWQPKPLAFWRATHRELIPLCKSKARWP